MGKRKTPKYTSKYMCDMIYEYTEREDVPVLKDVCYQQGWNYDTVMKYQRDDPKLKAAIHQLLLKKESALEILALYGHIHAGQAKFSLMQLGWKQQQEMVLVQDVEDTSPLANLIASGLAEKDEE